MRCITRCWTGWPPEAARSRRGLIATIAAGADGPVRYALEGSVFVAGAAIQWLRDELGMLESAARTDEICRQLEDAGGVYIVPAFVGLGAPYWEPYARGTIVGLTRGVTREQLCTMLYRYDERNK